MYTVSSQLSLFTPADLSRLPPPVALIEIVWLGFYKLAILSYYCIDVCPASFCFGDSNWL